MVSAKAFARDLEDLVRELENVRCYLRRELIATFSRVAAFRGALKNAVRHGYSLSPEDCARLLELDEAQGIAMGQESSAAWLRWASRRGKTA